MKSRPSVFATLTFLISLMALQLAAPRAHAAKPPALDESLVRKIAMPAAIVGSPALNFDASVVYVATANRWFYALDAASVFTEDPAEVPTADAAILWSVRLPAAPTSAPTINDDGLIYVGTANGSIYGITDLGDAGEISFATFVGAGKVASPAVDDDGNIYAGTTGNGLHALRPDSSKLWSTFFSNDVRAPMIAEGKIFVVAGGWVRGVNLENGAVESSFTPRSAIQDLPALGLDGTVYFGANDSRVYALNASGDTNDWRFNTGKNVMSSPAVGADGSIYIGSDSARIFCLNTNGVLLWKVPTAAPVRSALSIGVDGTVYAGCDDGRLYAVSAAGELLWTVKTKNPVRSAAVIDPFGFVYIGSGRNLYAIKTEAAADDFDEAPWPMARKDRLHTARATECRPFLISDPLNDQGTNRVKLTNGESLSISVVVRAGSPVIYQWSLNGVEIDPSENRTATNATLVINGVSALDAGEYTVAAFNDCGDVDSDSFILDVDSGPVITMQPTNVFTLAGNTVTLRVGVVGTLPLSIQWKKDGVPIPNATNATFTITNAQPSDSSTNYSVMISNTFDMVSSDPVTVQVFPVTLTFSDHTLGAGHRHSLAVLTNRTLWAWGLDNFGQLGDNQSGGIGSNFVLRSIPTLVIGTNAATSNVWVSVSGGSRDYDPSTNQPGGFSLGIQTNGTLWAWGLNDHGQLGIASTTSQKIPTRVGTDTNWVQVEAGATHGIGLKRDGSIWTWGGNEFGQLGIGKTNANSTSPVRVGTDSAWVEVRAGGFFNLARRADGTIWAWGTNRFGELGLGFNTGNGANSLRRAPVMIGTNSDWAGISAGAFHALALKTNGTIWSWGRGHLGQLGTGGSSEGQTHNQNEPVQIGTSSNWTTIEAGSYHSFAINLSGELFAWGWNTYGQLGNGEIDSGTSSNEFNKSTPVQVGAGMTWRLVDASDHSLGMTTDGRIWAWGLNNFGQVGDGTGGDGTRNNNRSMPVELSFLGTTNNPATNPPAITSQPASRMVMQGNPATFVVEATGGLPLAYQWYFNSVAIPSATNSSATNSSLQIQNVQSENVGFYFAVVTNLYGRATSSVATLNATNSSGQPLGPTNAPVFTVQPVDMVANEGSTVTFSSMATGSVDIVYQWYFSTNLLASQTNASLVLNNVQGSNSARFYYAVATNLYGIATSATAGLTITNTNGLVFPPSNSGTGSGSAISNSAPIITQQPVSKTAGTNTGANLSVSAIGATPLIYSWRLNSNVIDRTTTPTPTNAVLVITNPRPVGTYFYDVIVSNSIGAVTSAVAQLVVTNGGLPDGSKVLSMDATSAEVFLESIQAGTDGVSIFVRGGSEGQKWVLEYKELLGDSEWKVLGTNAAGKTLLVDPAPPLDRSRYYRVRVE